MAVANVAVLVLRAGLMALIASVTLLAHTFGALCFGIHEACSLTRTHITLTSTRAFDSAVLAKEALLALAHCRALGTMLHACTTLAATTDTAEAVLATFHRTITALETSLAQTLSTT